MRREAIDSWKVSPPPPAEERERRIVMVLGGLALALTLAFIWLSSG